MVNDGRTTTRQAKVHPNGLAELRHGEKPTAAGRLTANLGAMSLKPLPVLTTWIASKRRDEPRHP